MKEKVMISDSQRIALCQKYYLKFRAVHNDLAYLHGIATELGLDPKLCNMLSEMNLTSQKLHDVVRDIERKMNEKITANNSKQEAIKKTA